MNTFIIKELWGLRAELDNAILSKEYAKITEVKLKYKRMMEAETSLNNVFTSYNYGYVINDELQKHNFANMNSIYVNIKNFEKKYIEGEAVSTKLKLPYSASFLAGEIWILRAMYDKFLAQSKKCREEWQVEQNMILGQAVQERLKTLLYMVQTDRYFDMVIPLFDEVKAGYERIYGKKQPKVEYMQIAEDYQDK